MKTTTFFRLPGGLLGLLMAWSLSGFSHPLQAATRPTITSIRPERADIVLTVQVPVGLRKLTLESRERFGSGAWEPRVVQRLDGNGGDATLRLPRSRNLELLRVRADAQEALPASFYQGTNTFAGEPTSDASYDSRGIATFDGGNKNAPPTDAAPTREVVESDIWKIRGQTLYFFNQYRGLQIIDITKPDAAVVSGTLDLPASGEQMYTLGDKYMVLLARNGCYYSSGQESRVVVVADNNGTPAVTAELPLNGYILESRMVGTALYVASQAYRVISKPDATSTTWEWGLMVSSFDLADPNSPVVRDTIWYPGYGNDVTATDRFLFVLRQDPNNSWTVSTVSVVDISAPDGSMRAVGSVYPAGRVQDKYKVNLSGDVLTIISQVQQGTNLFAKLQTFSMANPAAPMRLGELSLGVSEQLYATRFDGNRVYVVTFHVQFRMDPLWVVDLSDPVKPALKGQLEIPGWSTYLEPLGNRLVALGIETNRTTVSLFDVADPAEPALLSRVALGSGWSWSEANNDEKAFKVLPEDNLILVPFYSWSTNGSVVQVQLVDLLPQEVVARGAITQKMQARRATLFQDRILSISGRELVSVDASDRDHPVTRGATELSWPVDRLVMHGDYLVEVDHLNSGGYYWWYWPYQTEATSALLRVVPTAEPDRLLESFDLGDLPILGVTAREDRLYVLQGPAVYYYPYLVYAKADGTGQDANAVAPSYRLVLTIFDLKALPQLSPIGKTETTLEHPIWGSGLQALWPKPGLLVWASDGGSACWRCGYALDAVRVAALSPTAPATPALPVANGAVTPASLAAIWPGYYGGDNQLLAFEVRDPAAPEFASVTSLSFSNSYNFSQKFTADGLVYVTRSQYEFVPGLDSPYKTQGYTNVYVDSNTGEKTINAVPTGSWLQRYFLEVIDYADPAAPTIRQPVAVSGMLQGLARNGVLLYVTSSHYEKTTNYYNWYEQLDALAYDGVSAFLVDSLRLPNQWPHPLLASGNNIFLGRAGYDSSGAIVNPNYVETWTLPDTGKFTQIGKFALKQPLSTLQMVGDVLVAQENNNFLAIFDPADPANLRLLHEALPPTCYWFDLPHADGDAAHGLWAPLGDYGVMHLPVLR
jgi:hypothetical protein